MNAPPALDLRQSVFLPSLEQIRAEKLLRAIRRDGEAVKAECRTLLGFVRRFWHVLEPKRELIEGWALEAMCFHLEDITKGGTKRLLINVPPGFMKSLLVNVFWPAFEWGPMGLTSMRYVAFSYASSLTERDNGKFRDLILSREYQALWGDQFQLRTVGVTKIENDKTGWKLASSIGGVGTGERGDRVLLDDPHNVKEAESETVRKATVTWFVEAMSNRLNDLDESAIVVIMQRVHESDVSGEIIASDFDYTHLMIPWDYDSGRHCETDIGWEDPRTEDGEPAWPERFSKEAMAKFRGRIYMWAAQYQQSPAPRGGGIIKRDSWQLWEPPDGKSFPPFEIVLGSLDTAYTEKQENDFSALTVWGVWRDEDGNPRIMLIYAWQRRLALHDLVTLVAETCRTSKVDRLLIESKAAGISVAQEMRRLYSRASFGVQLVDPRAQDKLARVYSIEHLFSDGVVWAPDRTWAEEVIAQCETFPKGSHDDLVDTVSQALRFLRDSGLLLRKDEAEAERHEQMRYRRAPQPLYPS